MIKLAAHVLHKQTLPPRARGLLIPRIGWLNHQNSVVSDRTWATVARGTS